MPAVWVAQSTRPHLSAHGELGYGYFWWTGLVAWQGESVPWGAAFGNGGQRLFLVPRLNLAVVMTAGAYNDAGIAIKEMELFRQIIAAVQR